MSKPKSSSSSPLATVVPHSSQPITAAQITELYHLLGIPLSKAKISSDLMQRVIDDHGNLFVINFLLLVEDHIEIVTGFELLRVKVNRAQTAYEAIDAISGRYKSIDLPDGILEAAPKNECSFAKKLHFFTLGREANNDEVQQEYEKRGLRPADVWEICAFNAQHSNFATDRPNAVLFWEVDGRCWYVAFGVSDDGIRFVAVKYVVDLWSYDWWFMGLPKEQ